MRDPGCGTPRMLAGRSHWGARCQIHPSRSLSLFPEILWVSDMSLPVDLRRASRARRTKRQPCFQILSGTNLLLAGSAHPSLKTLEPTADPNAPTGGELAVEGFQPPICAPLHWLRGEAVVEPEEFSNSAHRAPQDVHEGASANHIPSLRGATSEARPTVQNAAATAAGGTLEPVPTAAKVHWGGDDPDQLVDVLWRAASWRSAVSQAQAIELKVVADRAGLAAVARPADGSRIAGPSGTLTP